VESIKGENNLAIERILVDPDPAALTEFLRNNLDHLLRSTDETYLIILRASQQALLDLQDFGSYR
jgi:hypothetical protein